jgi:hypothetical protein
VDDALLVCIVERDAHLPQDIPYLAERQGALGFQDAPPQGGARYIVHHQEGQVLIPGELVEAYDVLMGQPLRLCASRRKRSTNSRSSAKSARMTLMATG